MRRGRRGSTRERGECEFRIEATVEGNPSLRITVGYTIFRGEPASWDDPGSGDYAEVDSLPVGLSLAGFEHDLLQQHIVDTHEWGVE